MIFEKKWQPRALGGERAMGASLFESCVTKSVISYVGGVYGRELSCKNCPCTLCDAFVCVLCGECASAAASSCCASGRMIVPSLTIDSLRWCDGSGSRASIRIHFAASRSQCLHQGAVHTGVYIAARAQKRRRCCEALQCVLGVHRHVAARHSHVLVVEGVVAKREAYGPLVRGSGPRFRRLGVFSRKGVFGGRTTSHNVNLCSRREGRAIT